ncbi:MAG: GNAT family N-acetyltransferase [Candidatus Eisenbacteria bacterium]|nr:GNAT family N-acetyltransferase [Candidatus Eisenbacteria bacterium]
MPVSPERDSPRTRRARASLCFASLTADRWSDFKELLGRHGGAGGCWCMWWRLSKADFDAGKGDANCRAMRAIVRSGRMPGILAYHEGRPVGWCSVAPREEFPRLERTRLFKRLDDEPVWSVVCLYVAAPHRRLGVATALLRAAVDFVRARGGRVVEGYAVEPKSAAMPPVFAYQGLAASYRRAGFREVARPSPTRPIMRRSVGKVRR